MSVTIPVGADAQHTSSHDGVYELQATVAGIQPAAPYDTDVVVYTGNTQSQYGIGVASNLRAVNGDLCVVPYVGATGGGETAIAHGTLGAESDDYAYAGRFGGYFKDFDGSLTSSDYFGRTIEEVNTLIANDTCFDKAILLGYSVAIDGLHDYEGDSVGGGHSWTVEEITGEWGECATESSLDTIGSPRTEVERYLSTLASPKVPDPSCGSAWGQKMRMVCRDFPSGADWKEWYVDFNRTAGTAMYWNGGGSKASWGWRGTVSTAAGRTWGGSASCSD